VVHQALLCQQLLRANLAVPLRMSVERAELVFVVVRDVDDHVGVALTHDGTLGALEIALSFLRSSACWSFRFGFGIGLDEVEGLVVVDEVTQQVLSSGEELSAGGALVPLAAVEADQLLLVVPDAHVDPQVAGGDVGVTADLADEEAAAVVHVPEVHQVCRRHVVQSLRSPLFR